MELKDVKDIQDLIKHAQDLGVGSTEYVLRQDPKTKAEKPVRKKQKDPFLAQTPKPDVPQAKI